jgi:LDH2 family malate/lactate/ureidoglycolate dehydrogenase
MSQSPNRDAAGGSRYHTAPLTDWAARVLETVQVPRDDARQTAQALVRCDLRGFGTHGLARLKSYVERLRAGDFNAQPRIAFDRRGPVWTVDADGALGQMLGQRVIDEAVRFLADQPMLWVSVRETGHLGALGLFALEAAERGLICFLGQRTPPILGLPGFRRRALGHNPFAFGAPVDAGEPPFVLDMACSVAARGHILLAAREGKTIPEGWALTAGGEPTTDSREAAAGILLPAGGYKGMALAMMIECLSAALPASPEIEPVMDFPIGGALPRQSAFFFFLNPGEIAGRDTFDGYMRHWIDFYRESGDGARIPGARGQSSERDGLAHGLRYPAIIEDELRKLGTEIGVPFPSQRESS